MDILILGGTHFLGRYLVEIALARSHSVALFNRGKTNPELFPQLEHFVGDRDGGLHKIPEKRHWDAVIDTCGYLPRIVQASAERLAEQTDVYLFVSSISVYDDFSQPQMDESAPVGTLADESIEQVDGESYGPLKALCEARVEAALPGRALHVRPGLIVGPNDPTDRFSYWVHRVAQGGEVLTPPDFVTQVVDVRDLSDWMIRLVEAGKRGVYNATGPDYRLWMSQFLESCRQASGSDAQFTAVYERFLSENNVQPWSDLPLWLSREDGEYAGFSDINVQKAVADGLVFRPILDTTQDTLRWLNSRPKDHEWRAGITRQREAELLALWRNR